MDLKKLIPGIGEEDEEEEEDSEQVKKITRKERQGCYGIEISWASGSGTTSIIVYGKNAEWVSVEKRKILTFIGKQPVKDKTEPDNSCR